MSLKKLSEKGYTSSQLEDLRHLIQGEVSDLFDVLSYIAYHKELVPRLERASRARVQIQIESTLFVPRFNQRYK